MQERFKALRAIRRILLRKEGAVSEMAKRLYVAALLSLFAVSHARAQEALGISRCTPCDAVLSGERKRTILELRLSSGEIVRGKMRVAGTLVPNDTAHVAVRSADGASREYLRREISGLRVARGLRLSPLSMISGLIVGGLVGGAILNARCDDQTSKFDCAVVTTIGTAAGGLGGLLLGTVLPLAVSRTESYDCE
jgi:hypothetical protein